MRRFSALTALTALTTLSGLTLAACGGDDAASPAPAGTTDEGAYEVVPDGKADNYYSSVAAEFEITGSLPVTMTQDEFNDEAVRADLVSRRLTAFGLYLTTYVTDKFRGIDSNNDGTISESEVFFHNDTYGGFQTMVRNYSIETLDISGDPAAGYVVKFTVDMAGPRDLISKLPFTTVDGGGKLFQVKMPKGKTVDPDSVPRGDVRNFNPETYQGELETVDCTVEKLPELSNAWPAYVDFTKDGVYDLTLFYGHDYNTSRSDLREARAAFDLLQDEGFKSPVAAFDDLKADSGVFKRTAIADGKEIAIEVRIFHSEMFKTDRKGQHDLALSEIVARDVFFYNGHAGPYFGFYLDEARQATVNYWEFAEAPFTDKQQLVIAQGCQTYSQYADMLYANPAKGEHNLDVITTVNYSYGQGTEELLRSLIQLDAEGVHQPVDFYTLVGDLNEDRTNSWKGVFYGVMGIDGNTQLHPYAHVENIGKTCTTAEDCGGDVGNVCISASIGAKTCAAKTLTESACPENTNFQYLAQRGTIVAGACLKK